MAEQHLRHLQGQGAAGFQTCRAMGLSHGVRWSGVLSAGTPLLHCSWVWSLVLQSLQGSPRWAQKNLLRAAPLSASSLFLPTTPPYLKITILRKTGVILLYIELFVRSWQECFLLRLLR